MIVINLSHLFQDEAKLKAKADIKNYLANRDLNRLIRFKLAMQEREEKTGITNYSNHILDRAIMYAQGKKDFHKIEKQIGGFTSPQLSVCNRILHSAHKVSMESVYNSASQFLRVEADQKRENNPFYKISRRIFNKLF